MPRDDEGFTVRGIAHQQTMRVVCEAVGDVVGVELGRCVVHGISCSQEEAGMREMGESGLPVQKRESAGAENLARQMVEPQYYRNDCCAFTQESPTAFHSYHDICEIKNHQVSLSMALQSTRYMTTSPSCSFNRALNSHDVFYGLRIRT